MTELADDTAEQTSAETGSGDATEAAAGSDSSSSALGWAGLVAGLLGLAAGGLALARTRSTS